MKVPFLWLPPVYEELRPELDAAFARVMRSGWFILGDEVRAWEEEFARYCGAAHCVGVASGLDAMVLTLRAWDVGPGDEVIVPSNTYIATWLAPSQVGARPVPVEPVEATYNIDPARIEAAITPRTRAIIPVHLYGQAADMAPIREIAARRGIRVLEDAAQAAGARYRGKRVGALGDAGAFSFYPGKNLGAMGDAGAFVTNDDRLAARLRALREHGQARKHVHEVPGWTARLDTFQALVLSLKLPHLEEWNAERRAAAAFYLEALSGVGDLRLPPVAHGSEPVWHVFAVRTEDAEGLVASLAARGVQTGRHYPVPPHLSPAYAHLGYRAGSFPVTESLARELVSLPLFPGITEEQLVTVTAAVAAHFDG
jgi:dTDP-4-amino-4,6-dideoxygalactose transaminase